MRIAQEDRGGGREARAIGGRRRARQVLRGAMGLGSVPLPGQALIGLELVTVLVDIFVDARGLVEGRLGRPPRPIPEFRGQYT